MDSEDTGAVRTIFLIRHGEKPTEEPQREGVDQYGRQNPHSLIPRGWERAGALATLFAPFIGSPRPGLLVPEQLVSPRYENLKGIGLYRTHQTIEPTEERLGIPIETAYSEEQLPELVASLTAPPSGTTLVCWEHTQIIEIAQELPVSSGTIPSRWPSERFDMVFSFSRGGTSGPFAFQQIPQLLLAGDSATPFPS